MPGPWLKFYPTDWQSDPLLGTCSLAARGLWIEMLCVMHSAEPAGSLVRRGEPLSLPQIAILARTSPKEAGRLLDELETAGVFSRDDDGAIFSRRMRRDLSKAERDRQNGRAGGNPRLRRSGLGLDNPGVNPHDKAEDIGQDKAQIPEARSQRNPSRERGLPGGKGSTTPRLRQAHPPTDPRSAAWDDDAPFGRDAAGGAR